MNDVRTEISDGVARITIDRPPVNALTPPLLVELAQAFDELRDSREVVCAVLRAEGTRAFVAGMDLRWSPPPVDERPLRDVLDAGAAGRDAFRAVLECAVPVIAAVEAPAIGGGFALVACCDLVVASTAASFAMTEINLGVLGAGSHLMRMLGPYRARDLYLTGRSVGAAYLHEVGVVARVTEPGRADAEALVMAADLARKSPLGLRLAKEALRGAEGKPLMEGYRIEQEYTARLRQLDDSREAISAWREQRTPQWGWS